MKYFALLLVVGLCSLSHLCYANERSAVPIEEESAITSCGDVPAYEKPVQASFSEQFKSFARGLFNTSAWPARWYCGSWTSFHGWLYIASDTAIWLAYFMIPGVLFYFLVKRKDTLPFKSVFSLFIAFILACGLTHLIDAIIFWWPAYNLSALIRFGTAVVSWGTVFALVKVIPSALSLPSNETLRNEIKQRKAAENNLALKIDELETINQELESFSYSVSHDLRSPLRTIHGFTQALEEDYKDDLKDEAKDYLSRVSAASIRMGHLIDDILDLSRISRKELTRQEVDFTKLAKEVAREKKTMIEREITIDVEKNMVAKGDVGLIRILLENLVGNAIKYASPDRPADIEIGQKKNSKYGRVFFVKDNGVGFDMRYADKIFGAFQRLHSSNEFEGTGIGLTTVNRIINRHKGKIWVESEVDNGTTFFFTFNSAKLND